MLEKLIKLIGDLKKVLGEDAFFGLFVLPGVLFSAIIAMGAGIGLCYYVAVTINHYLK